MMNIPEAGSPALFDQLGREQLERLLHQSQDTEERQPQRKLCCTHCGRIITGDDQRIPIQGGHEHTFTNPHGLTFRIGCFASAPGCGQAGPPTAAWSWFAGYRWQIALCLGCGIHMGWRYRSPDGDGFHGLILKHLVPGDDH